MASAIISALVQLAVVLAIALVVYLVARKPGRSFLDFIGLIPAPARAILIGLGFGIATSLLVLQMPGMAELASREGATGHKAAVSGGLAPMLVIALAGALIQTSLTEEILFRGLIGRNLVRRIGFAWGNGIQALLFGLVHALIAIVPGVEPGMVVFAVLFSGVTGWVNGWLNEKLANGSILPGWAAHGAANLTTYLMVALVLTDAA